MLALINQVPLSGNRLVYMFNSAIVRGIIALSGLEQGV